MVNKMVSRPGCAVMAKKCTEKCNARVDCCLGYSPRTLFSLIFFNFAREYRPIQTMPDTNHSLHATQILPIIVKYRAINVEGNKRFPA